MATQDFFAAHTHINLGPVNGVPSIEDLRRKFSLNVQTKYPFDNKYLLNSSDDAGNPCILLKEYKECVTAVKKMFNDTDEKYVLEYMNSRVAFYESHRRGPCVALRGKKYYPMFQYENAGTLRNLFQQFLLEEIGMLRFLTRAKGEVPLILGIMVLEHFKNIVFQIMYSYVQDSISGHIIFDKDDWYTLDKIVRMSWEMLVKSFLDEKTSLYDLPHLDRLKKISKTLNLHILGKVRELDSAKTLLKMAHKISLKRQRFDVCVSMLYGGIEIPYAIRAYSIYTKEQAVFDATVPCLFSYNRMKKGVISPEIIGDDGLIKPEMMNTIIPEFFLEEVMNSSNSVLVVDNNFTTGYSIVVFSKSIAKCYQKVSFAVAEANLVEIQAVSEMKNTSKKVIVSPEMLYVMPIGDYVTCFGLDDNSRVVNRVKRIIFEDTHFEETEGYDFDNTLFKTSQLHRLSWNHALEQMGFTDIDVTTIPSNSGLTMKESAKRILFFLRENNLATDLEDNYFVKNLCNFKTEYFLREVHQVIPIAKGINLAKNINDNTKVIVSNNHLDIVLKVLKKYKLTRFFAYIVCADYAFCVKTRERVSISGRGKPSVEAYEEVSDYFGIPKMTIYVGDHKDIDGAFAEKLNAKFIFI